jgi:DNA repair protein RecO (recombination protein O)
MDYHDLAKKMYSFIIVDLSNQVVSQKQIEQSEIDEIYNILVETITKIDEGIKPDILLDIVMLKYLKYLGVLPNIDSCSMCGSNNDIVTMDSKSFGFICQECYNGERMVNKKALKLIRMLYYVDISKINNLDVGEEYEDVHNFIDEYYEEHTGIYFNIKKQLMTLSKMKGIV